MHSITGGRVLSYDTDSGLLQLSGGLTLPLALKKPFAQSRLPPHHIRKRYFPL
jgi:hypothetical protein